MSTTLGRAFWKDAAMGWFGNVVVKTVINGAALYLAAAIVPGIHLGEEGSAGKTIVTILIVALIFGVINTVLKPLVKLLSLPFIVLTLGLFLLIINALMLQLTSWLAGTLDLSFHVDSFFWDAILGALIITVVASILNAIVPDPDRARR
jgi:putative membrane protein